MTDQNLGVEALRGQDRPAAHRGADADDVAERDTVSRLRAELVEAQTALAQARAREEELRRDLQHRVSNVLSVIRSIVRRTRESGASPDEVAEHLEGRINAVARSQSYSEGIGAPGIYLEDLLRDELLAVGCAEGSDCTIEGVPVRLGGKAAELMGLAIHELTTNSMKFGAIAQGGSLDVSWSIEPQPDHGLLCFAWTESGVSAIVAAPRPSGFGRELIELALPYQLGADTSFSFRPGGITCAIRLPLSLGCVAADPGEVEPPLMHVPDRE